MKSSKTSLVFAINGQRFELELSSIDPSTTLVDFLRNKTPFKSVKLGCGEGMMITIIKKLKSLYLHVLEVFFLSTKTLTFVYMNKSFFFFWTYIMNKSFRSKNYKLQRFLIKSTVSIALMDVIVFLPRILCLERLIPFRRLILFFFFWGQRLIRFRLQF